MSVDAAEAALRELNEEAAEAIRVHMDTREAQLIVNVDGWTRRERVPWMETATDLLAWIVEQAREALRVYRVLLTMEVPAGPMVRPMAPKMIGAAS